jgi:dihydroorotate dehydrogenase subfamily 2
MNKSSWRFRIEAWGYRNVVKPLLFAQNPEKVHERMLRVGKLLGKSGVTRSLVKSLFAYTDSRLEQEVFGLKFRNPVGLSAGFDKDADLVNILPSVGFGYFQVGSITAKSYKGNEKPWLYRLPKSKSIVVNYGLKNIGVKRVIRKLKRSRLKEVPVSISVAKTNCKEVANDEAGIQDYLESLSLLKESEVGDIYTLNISCPNAFGGEPFTEPNKLERLLVRIDELDLKKPMLVKMPVDLVWDEFKLLLDVVLRHRCVGVVISNLTKDRSDLKTNDDISNIKGGLSGKPTEEKANELISQTYKYCGDRLKIVGVGGVFSAEDAYEKIRRGATLVQLITGMIYEGPQLIGQINEGLVKLLETDGYGNIKEAVGSKK